MFTLVQFILLLPVIPVRIMGLLLFSEEKIPHDQVIHFGPHETAISIFRCADNGFSPDVEACIDDHAITGALPKDIDQLPVTRIGLLVDRLDPGGIIDVGDGRYIRSKMVEAVVKRE